MLNQCKRSSIRKNTKVSVCDAAICLPATGNWWVTRQWGVAGFAGGWYMPCSRSWKVSERDEHQNCVCEARLNQMQGALLVKCCVWVFCLIGWFCFVFFYGWIYKKILSYRYYAARICKMKPCPEPEKERRKLRSGPRSVCRRGLCWLQWRLSQVKKVWKGSRRWIWALLDRVVPVVRRRRC